MRLSLNVVMLLDQFWGFELGTRAPRAPLLSLAGRAYAPTARRYEGALSQVGVVIDQLPVKECHIFTGTLLDEFTKLIFKGGTFCGNFLTLAHCDRVLHRLADDYFRRPLPRRR